MPSELPKELHEISARLRRFHRTHRQLSEHKDSLEQRMQGLEEKLRASQAENDRLSEELERMQMSQALSNTGQDNGVAKRRIDEMVKEIDRCIALLND